MPSTATYRYTNNILLPVYKDTEEAVPAIPVNLVPSVTYVKGTVLGELTATPGTYKAYVAGATDGSQVPKAILPYDVVVDASGNISLAGAGGVAQFGATNLSVDVYVAGSFKTSELVQSGAGAVDAAAIAALGHLISGVLADGVWRIG